LIKPLNNHTEKDNHVSPLSQSQSDQLSLGDLI